VVLASPTVSAGLEAASVGRTTWYRWKQDTGFRSALTHLQREILRESLGDLQGAARFATKVLLGLLTSSNEHVRMQAALHVMNLGLRGVELLNLDERMAELEAVLGPLIEAAELPR